MKTQQIKRSAPTVARLQKYLECDDTQAKRVREIIHFAPTAFKAIKQIDLESLLLNGATYGVEALVINPFALPSQWDRNVPFAYINAGDTYTATLVAMGDRVFISCWGDEYERLPERIKKLDPWYGRGN